VEGAIATYALPQPCLRAEPTESMHIWKAISILCKWSCSCWSRHECCISPGLGVNAYEYGFARRYRVWEESSFIA
jgi:hypothetical protein